MKDHSTEPLPDLRRPVLVAAFGGWNDAGDAASAAVEHLSLLFDAENLYEIEPDDYYDYQSSRPVIHQATGVTRRLEWPSTAIAVCRPGRGDHDLILVIGLEPNLRWQSFCREIVDVAVELGVERAVVLGALMADVPHHRPVPITGTAESPETAKRFGLTESNYNGPTGITAVLQHAFIQAGVPAMGLWASVPHYVGHPPNPKATLALLRRLGEVLGTDLPTGVLPEQARQWEEAIDELAADDEDLAEYVRELDERGDHPDEVEPDPLTEVDGESLAAEFERYLRGRGDQD
ncbi:PAC2 family protein [Gordonia sp. VNK21]|uniref:PAC2 family protein n=1 Tax=Gordonia sp. VNK21 TaxID=3382483 RepID=UPI0038D4E640